MKITQNNLVFDIIKKYPNHVKNHKYLILTDSVEKESKSVKLKFEGSEEILNTFDTIVNSIPNDRKYFILTKLDNIVIEVFKEDDLLSIFYHIKFENEIYTHISCFGGKNYKHPIKTPSFSSELPIGLRLQLENNLKSLLGGVLRGKLEDMFFFTTILMNVLPLIVYLELSNDNIKLSVVPPKSSVGTIMKNNQVKNTTKIKMYRIDSTWNTTTISVGGFKVSGHFRLQRCGVNFSMVKLIFIEPFMKNHYIRKSTRDMVFN